MGRQAQQSSDPSSSPVLPQHQADQFCHQPAASGSEQLSYGILHRAGCCDPARRSGKTHSGPL